MKYMLLLMAAITIVTLSFGQDTIIKTNGYKIPCRVLWVTSSKIKYKHLTDSSQRMSVSTKSVYLIKYANGEKDYNKNLAKGKDTAWHFDDMSPAQRGKNDADEYYVRWRGAKAAGGWGSALVGPLFGLVPTIIVASSPPADKRLGYPSPEMMKNDTYVQAYKTEAYKIKKKKAWKGYLVGVIVDVGFAVLVLI